MSTPTPRCLADLCSFHLVEHKVLLALGLSPMSPLLLSNLHPTIKNKTILYNKFLSLSQRKWTLASSHHLLTSHMHPITKIQYLKPLTPYPPKYHKDGFIATQCFDASEGQNVCVGSE